MDVFQIYNSNKSNYDSIFSTVKNNSENNVINEIELNFYTQNFVSRSINQESYFPIQNQKYNI